MLSLIFLLAAAPAGEDYRITAYTRDQLHVYDAKGTLSAATMAKSALPAAPQNIVDVRHDHLGIKLADGKVVYLRNAEVLTTARPPVCTDPEIATRKAGSVTAATPGGVKAGVSTAALRCIAPGSGQ